MNFYLIADAAGGVSDMIGWIQTHRVRGCFWLRYDGRPTVRLKRQQGCEYRYRKMGRSANFKVVLTCCCTSLFPKTKDNIALPD